MESIEIEGVGITYFGRSSFLLEHAGKNLYFDPVGIPAEIAEAKKADLILVSHADAENASSSDIEKLLQENTGLFGPQVVEDSIGPDTRVVAEGDELSHSDIQFAVVPAYSEGNASHPRDKGFGYEVIFGGLKLYFAGDTDLIPGMKDRNDIDIAFLPIGGEYAQAMDYRDAVEAVRYINPRYVIPMHYATDIHNPADNFRLAADEYAQIVVMHGGDVQGNAQ
jgi:L-ascorbate metabolism protein UlaG (beta-lactamase superfamily)